MSHQPNHMYAARLDGFAQRARELADTIDIREQEFQEARQDRERATVRYNEAAVALDTAREEHKALMRDVAAAKPEED